MPLTLAFHNPFPLATVQDVAPSIVLYNKVHVSVTLLWYNSKTAVGSGLSTEASVMPPPHLITSPYFPLKLSSTSFLRIQFIPDGGVTLCLTYSAGYLYSSGLGIS